MASKTKVSHLVRGFLSTASPRRTRSGDLRLHELEELAGRRGAAAACATPRCGSPAPVEGGDACRLRHHRAAERRRRAEIGDVRRVVEQVSSFCVSSPVVPPRAKKARIAPLSCSAFVGAPHRRVRASCLEVLRADVAERRAAASIRGSSGMSSSAAMPREHRHSTGAPFSPSCPRARPPIPTPGTHSARVAVEQLVSARRTPRSSGRCSTRSASARRPPSRRRPARPISAETMPIDERTTSRRNIHHIPASPPSASGGLRMRACAGRFGPSTSTPPRRSTPSAGWPTRSAATSSSGLALIAVRLPPRARALSSLTAVGRGRRWRSERRRRTGLHMRDCRGLGRGCCCSDTRAAAAANAA